MPSDPRPSSSPEVPTEAARRFGFWTFAGHLLSVWGIALSNTLLGLTILWSGFSRRHLRWHWPSAAPLMIPLGVYAIFFAISALTSIEPLTSAKELKTLIGLATVPLAILIVRGAAEVRRIFDLIILMMVPLALYGIGQYFLTDYGPLDDRIPGPFSHYMTYSGVLLLGVLLLFGRLTANKGRGQPLCWLVLLLVGSALLLTLTRGAWIAAGVILAGVLLRHARRYLLAYLIALLAAGVFAAALAPETWKARIVSITDPRNESNYDRLSMLQAGLFMIAERPLFGIGPAMVRHRYPIYRHPTAPRFKANHLHNSFLQIAAERGLLSLAAYLWLMGAAIRLTYQGYRREGGDGGDNADLYLGILLAVIGFNVAGLFEANWRDTEIQRLVLFTLAAPVCLRSQPPSKPALDRP
ncbi:MAG: O-antigen ligase family protein [Acidobacteriota bacterium]